MRTQEHGIFEGSLLSKLSCLGTPAALVFLCLCYDFLRTAHNPFVRIINETESGIDLDRESESHGQVCQQGRGRGNDTGWVTEAFILVGTISIINVPRWPLDVWRTKLIYADIE